jgi:hypothetical protein
MILIACRIAAKADRTEKLENDKALLVDTLSEVSISTELKPSQRSKLSRLLQKAVPTAFRCCFSDFLLKGDHWQHARKIGDILTGGNEKRYFINIKMARLSDGDRRRRRAQCIFRRGIPMAEQ